MTREEQRERKIRLVTKQNPRRPGTAAHKFYEAMKGSKTVGDYLRRFRGDARRDAVLWLNASTRQNHVKLVA